MYPAETVFGNQLRELYLPLLLHLLNELEQATVISLVASDDVCSAAEHVMTVLHAPDERVEFLTAVATANHNGLAPRFADGVKELVYEYVQQVVCTLRWTIVDALAQRCGAGGKLLDGKVFHV